MTKVGGVRVGIRVGVEIGGQRKEKRIRER